MRFYYRQRLFMGFCCVCCEILYLSLYLLHFPDFQRWPLLPLQLPGILKAHLNGEREPFALALSSSLMIFRGSHHGMLEFRLPVSLTDFRQLDRCICALK